MRGIYLLKKVALVLAAGLLSGTAYAQNGAPHSLTGSANYSTVSLSWKAPADEITLQWHDGKDYNGMDGQVSNPARPAVIYAAAKFTPADLKAVAGQQVDSIFYFEYRHCYKVNVQIYENGTLVRDEPVDVTEFTKNTWKHASVGAPYTIPADAEVMFAVRYEHGSNQTYVANTDRSPQRGKGDIYSYDGKTWQSGAVGDFMITAHVKNNATATPSGYNVYRDGTKVNSEVLSALETELQNEPDGTHAYTVGAVYEAGEQVSSPISITSSNAATMLPPVASLNGYAEGLNGYLYWDAPIAASNVLTWTNSELKTKIGGTSTSSPKVWIKQDFSSGDILAFQGKQIDSVCAYVAEATLATAKVFVLKNGVIDYYEDIPDSVVTATAADTWLGVKLAKPYVMTAGNSYAYGFYYTHTKSTHPVGVDSSNEIDGKGNCFSITTPKTAFNTTSPTWKTLSSGSINGNFMLKAIVSNVDGSPIAASSKVAGYDVYRDGTLIESGVKDDAYLDEVSAPGYYTYTVVPKYENGAVASGTSTAITYDLPAEYEAPLIVDYNFNDTTKQFNLEWSNSAVELQHYGTPSYIAGFDEEMTLLYGAKFTAAELEPYSGYQIRSLKFALGAALDTFKIEVRTGDNQVLFSETIDGSIITPLALYSMKIDPIDIPAGKDVYLAYGAKIPASTNAIILDGGPAEDGGAMVSLADGASWMKLGTIASSYKDYNIVIGATILPKSTSGTSAAKPVEIGTSLAKNSLDAIELSAEQVREAAAEGLGVAAEGETTAPAKAAKKAKVVAKAPARDEETSTPKVKSYNVYCNGEVVSQQTATVYKETINKYGQFTYVVTAVYNNDWESANSKATVLTNNAPQRAEAPYNLTGDVADDAFVLNWEAASKAPVFTYEKQDTSDISIGMTGSGTRKSYCAIKLSTDTLTAFAGKRITHIKFKLSSLDVQNPNVFFCVGDNIIYTQELDASKLVLGWNVVRLDEPFDVSKANQDLMLGYYIEYANGIKPSVCDANTPAVPSYSDIISTSATAGYWYSLKTRFSLDYGWRIRAVFANADTTIHKAPRRDDAAPAITYNVYRDGALVASGITSTTHSVGLTATGSYTVTATVDGEETAESNVVVYQATTGVDDVKAAKAVAGVEYYNAAGVKTAEPQQGVNLVVTRYTDGSTSVAKVVK